MADNRTRMAQEDAAFEALAGGVGRTVEIDAADPYPDYRSAGVRDALGSYTVTVDRIIRYEVQVSDAHDRNDAVSLAAMHVAMLIPAGTSELDDELPPPSQHATVIGERVVPISSTLVNPA